MSTRSIDYNNYRGQNNAGPSFFQPEATDEMSTEELFDNYFFARLRMEKAQRAERRAYQKKVAAHATMSQARQLIENRRPA